MPCIITIHLFSDLSDKNIYQSHHLIGLLKYKHKSAVITATAISDLSGSTQNLPRNHNVDVVLPLNAVSQEATKAGFTKGLRSTFSTVQCIIAVTVKWIKLPQGHVRSCALLFYQRHAACLCQQHRLNRRQARLLSSIATRWQLAYVVRKIHLINY